MFGVSFSFWSCTCYCQASERKSPPYSLPFVRFFSRGVERTSKATVWKELSATRDDWIRMEEKGGRGGGGEDDDGGEKKRKKCKKERRMWKLSGARSWRTTGMRKRDWMRLAPV